MLNNNSLVNAFWRWGLVFTTSQLLVVFESPGFAQIQPDNTLGTESSVVNSIDALSDRIDGGVKLNANLFHSFREFNVGENRGVYFANPQGITDIFSRVTGNNPSNIFGKLGVLGNANLFLINPNGIVFGENASLDVGGSFVASTANAIEFGEQGLFSATQPEAPQLLAVQPSALFFNQVSSGNITVRSVAPAGISSSGIEVVGLRVPDGRSLLLIGGDVNFEGGQSSALGGHLELGGLKEPGSIELQIRDETLKLGFPDDILLANVTLKDDARASVQGAGGGNLIVNTDTYTATSGGRLIAGTQKPVNGGDVTINANNFIITGFGSSGIPSGLYNQATSNVAANSGNIVVNTKIFDASLSAGIQNRIDIGGKGDVGNIDINADFLSLRNGSQINSSNFGQGNSGSIKIDADTVEIIGISTDRTFPSGVGSINFGFNSQAKAGNVTLNTRILNIRDGGVVTSQANNQGKSGDLIITARESLNISGIAPSNLPNNPFFRSGLSTSSIAGSGEVGNLRILDTGIIKIENGGVISTSTETQGAGGNIEIDADTIEIIGASTDGQFPSGLGSETRGVNSQAKAGNVILNTRILNIRDGGIISTQTFNQGNSGNLTLTARELLNISGTGTLINGYVNRSGLFMSTQSSGTAGNIKIIDTGTIKIEDGGAILASTFNQGNGGTIEIITDTLELSGVSKNEQLPSTLATETSGINSLAKAGDITLNSRILNLRDGAVISTQTFNQGKGGNLTLIARESLNINGNAKLSNNQLFRSAISTSTIGWGDAGNLKIVDTGIIKIEDGGAILASTFNQGNGGNIEINADTLELIGASADGQFPTGVGSETFGIDSSANAGNVTLDTRILNIRDGAILSTLSTNQGLAGNITIQNSERIQLTNGNILSTSSQSSGGAINITAKDIRLFGDSDIATNVFSGAGGGGNITINANTIIALDDSDILSFAGDGKGGDITFNTQGFFSKPLYRPNSPTNTDANALTALDNNNRVDVNASGAVSGAVTGVPDTTFIQDSLTELPDNRIDTNTIIANSCVVRSNQQNGTFLITGSGGLPINPTDAPLSSYSTGSIRSIPSNLEKSPASTNRPSWKIGDPVVEPQGVYKLPHGQLVLSQKCS